MRRNEIDHACRLVFDRRVLRIEIQALIGIERREIVKIGAVTHCFRIIVIDFEQLGQREIAFPILGCANFALDGVACAQAHLANLVRRDVNIIRTGKIIGLRAAQKAEAILQHFNRTDAEYFLTIFRHFLEDGEHQVLAAHGRRAFDAQFFGHRDKLCRRPLFKFFQMHCLYFRIQLGCRRANLGLEKADPVAYESRPLAGNETAIWDASPAVNSLSYVVCLTRRAIRTV